jgi:hypothetical protein
VVFLDIDGVLNNRGCFRPGNCDPRFGRNPDPFCVDALNYITETTGAKIVVSSTWRISGLEHMRETMRRWGVTGEVMDITPRLETRNGDIWLSAPRGTEIQAWLADSDNPPFVILDDDSDMEHLSDRLVQTNFEQGLTWSLACQAIKKIKAASRG